MNLEKVTIEGLNAVIPKCVIFDKQEYPNLFKYLTIPLGMCSTQMCVWMSLKN